MRAARLVAPVVLLALVAGCGTSSTPETTKPAPVPKVSDEEIAKKVAEKARQEREEVKAKALLRSGLQLADKGFKPQARKRYQEVIDKYPGSEAAAKAKKLLEGEK